MDGGLTGDSNTRQRKIIADLHCHVFPAEAAANAGTAITVVPEGENYRFTAGSQSLLLERGLIDLDLQIGDMQRQGVSRRALSIPPFTLGYALPPQEGIRWTRAINDGIVEMISAHPDQFSGFATVPLQDVRAAVDELDRAITELGLAGVEIATNINGVELDAAGLDPFWDRVQALGIPILIHPHDVAGADRMDGYYLRNLIGNPVETALTGARLIFGGVLERYPDLHIILAHGGGALPHLVGRLSHGYRVRTEAKVRAATPIESLRRLYYDTIVFDSRVLRHVVEIVGESQVILGTDYPFDMGESDPIQFVRNAGLSESQVNTILSNGNRLLEAEQRTAPARD